jgi:serine phosphatase RsbU (regulator of sigma subunit)
VVLRPVPAKVGPLRVAVSYRAAAEGASIGGDVYDVTRTPYGVCVLLGDVCGKGLTAVRTGADVLGAFRELSRTERDLASLAARLDATVSHSAHDGGTQDGMAAFVTAVLLRVPDGGREAELVNCGHPSPMLLRDGRAMPVDPRRAAPPLGLLDLGEGFYRVEKVPFDSGDTLLLYTDGVSETRDGEGAFYPLAERLPRLTTTDPQALLDALGAELGAYARPGPSDDAAMLALRRR